MNRLYCGDNLSILQDLPSESVDLIATDPPFNTGKDWGAFNDKWEGGLKGYLKFMEPRLIECHRVLKGTGSLYLHCNPTASHYLKVMLDTIFGIKQFRNEIVWYYKFSKQFRNIRKYAQSYDTILFYTKTCDYLWNQQYQAFSESTKKRFKGKKEKRVLNDAGKEIRYVSDEISKGAKIRDVLIGVNSLHSNAKERLGYPTQKPRALYERIIKASSNEGDTVLDTFCGSGTTLDAAQSLGRQWIGIDQTPDAIEIVEKRLTDRHGMLLEYELIKG